MDYGSKKRYQGFDLTGRLIGYAFEIYNQLGFGHRELVYHKAFELLLNKNNITYQREKYGKIKFNGKIIGKYFIDFVIEDRVAAEFKVRNEIYKKDISQLLDYMISEEIETGLLITFTKEGVKLKRLINSFRENPRDQSAV